MLGGNPLAGGGGLFAQLGRQLLPAPPAGGGMTGMTTGQPSVAQGQFSAPPGMFQQILSQLHPEAQQALGGMSPNALYSLHNAGLIHPQLAGHLFGLMGR